MHSPRLLNIVTMLNLTTDTKKDSVKNETLFLHECMINLLQNRLLQNTHSSSLFLPVLEPPLILFWIHLALHSNVYISSNTLLLTNVFRTAYDTVTSHKDALNTTVPLRSAPFSAFLAGL